MLATTKEALNNVIKHSGATEAHLQMQWAEGAFELGLTDNGIGFELDSSAVHDGNGLRNMAARMQEIDGTLTISSRPGHGTVVTLRLPCPWRESPATPSR
ncbi:MAG: ATP-binding protein [Opitutaceae bacterium]